MKTMRSKGLVYRALAFEKVERCPRLDFTVPARDKLCASVTGRGLYELLRNDLLLSSVFRVEWG
jgi:hypothetical protein